MSQFTIMNEVDHLIKVRGLYDQKVIPDFSDRLDLSPGIMQGPTQEVDKIRDIREYLEHLTGIIKMMTKGLRRRMMINLIRF